MAKKIEAQLKDKGTRPGKAANLLKAICFVLLFFILAAHTYAQATYNITAEARSGGSISPSGDITVTSGEDQPFTFTPGAGYVVSDVIVDGFSLGPVNSYTFTNVTADHTIVAVFIQGTEPYLPDTAGDDQIYTTGVPPMVLLVMGRDHKLYYEAYNDASDLNGDGNLDVGYNPSIEYYGYFDSQKAYKYDSANQRFYPVRYTADKKVTPGANEWSGDFLNYLTMSRIDVLRKVLYGGYRSIDTTTETVLERAYIPNDAHCWGKEYKDEATDGYLISDYTPYSEPTAGNRHLFASGSLYAPGHTNYAPLLRVRLDSNDRIWTWVSAENADGIMGNTVVGTPIEDFHVRVLVGVSGYPEAKNEKKYIHSTTGATVWKPTGLLQRFGEPGNMLFGLISGSYGNHLSGGVLRKNIRSIIDEIDLDTGRFRYKHDSSVGGIIKTIDNFRVKGFTHRIPGVGGDGYWDQTIYSRPINEGENYMWGNPTAEMMYEGLRYFAGNNPTPEFSTLVSDGNDRGLDLPLETWEDPFEINHYCSKPFMLVISDINPSYDSDQLPGSAFGSFSGTFGTMNVQTLADEIFTEEGLGGEYYIGQSDGFYDTACSAKNVSGFGDIRGLCPEEPTKMGSYYSAAVAYYGRTNNASTYPQVDQNVLTYAVALASPLPRIEIPMADGNITLVPLAKTIYSDFGGSVRPDRGSFQPTSAIIDFYVEEITNTYGKFRVVYEHAEQGADFDMDAIITYEYTKTSDSAIDVTITSANVWGGSSRQHFGYIISGTTVDGVYLEIKNASQTDAGDPDYYLDTPGTCGPNTGPDDTCWNNGLPLPNSKTRAFTVNTGTSAATLLQDPLWYAAKWGGFNDLDGNGIPNLDSEWDSSRDGDPDTYFLVINPLELEEKLNQSFKDIISRGVSHVAPVVSVDEANRTQSGDELYMAFFKPIDSDHWQGNLKKYGLDFRPRDDCGRDEPEWTVVDKDGLTASNCDGSFRVNTKSYWSADYDGGFVDKGGVGEVMLKYQMPSNAQIENASLTLDEFHGFRNIYTYKTNSNANGSLTSFKRSQISSLDLGVADDGVRDSIINFVYGYTFDAEETSGLPIQKRDWILGDIIHSEPRIIDYFDTDGNLDYRFIAVGANDGMLHVFTDAEITLSGKTYPAGAEVFAFIPGDLLTELVMFGDPTAHPFMVDGSPNLFRASTRIDEGDIYDGYHHKTLVFGQRRGGRSYWALDVSKPDPSEWKVKWHIQGGSSGINTPVTGQIPELGYSWNKPFFTTLKIADDDFRDVVVFAGGYDPREDGFPEGFADANDNGIWDEGEIHAVTTGGTEEYDLYNPSTNIMGRGIFVRDLADGGILFEATFAGGESEVTIGNNQRYSQMKYCFPADMSVIPLSATELIIYAADIYGQIWKVTYKYNAQNKWEVKRIFAANPGSDMPSGNADWFLGENGQGPPSFDEYDQGRKTFYSPDVSYFGNEWTDRPVLYFGTGDRAHPRYRMIKNRFYVVADYNELTDERYLLNLTCGELNEDADANADGVVDGEDALLRGRLTDLLYNGWARGFYRVLGDQGNCIDDDTDHTGEHVLSQPTLFFRNIYFTSYQPVFGDPCNPMGNAFIYAMDYSYGTSIFDYDVTNWELMTVADSYLKISGSSIPSGVRIITRGGEAAGLISVGGAVSGVGEEQTTKGPGPPGGVTQIIWETGN